MNGYRRGFILLFLIVAFACQKAVQPADIAAMNGYWEIEKVILPGGAEKGYTINETIDYFDIKNNKGFRKKVKPQFDGKYLENGDAEAISVTFNDGAAKLHYKTAYMQWTEEIVSVSKEKLVLKNGVTEYHYKKAIPFSIK